MDDWEGWTRHDNVPHIAHHSSDIIYCNCGWTLAVPDEWPDWLAQSIAHQHEQRNPATLTFFSVEV